MEERTVPAVIYSATMDTDPGWAFDAGSAWAWGTPTGQGSHNLDPLSGFTASKVVGYNLAGDYPNNMITTKYATTPAIDTRGYTNVNLSFYRQLGVESSSYDHASIQVSNNGTSWVNVWSNGTSSISDSTWSLQQYDISAVADNQAQVFIRWGMGATDSSVTYPGWNIDDVLVQGTPGAPVANPLAVANPFAGSYSGSFIGNVTYLGVTQPISGAVAFTIDAAGAVTVTSPGFGQGQCDAAGQITIDAGYTYQGIVANLHASGTIVGASASGNWTASTTDGLGFGSGTWTAARSLPAPTPLSPNGSISTVTPTFTWTAVPGADHYDIWVNTVTSGVESVGNPVLRNQSASGTSWTPSQALAAGQTYRWYISAIAGDGTHGLWSSGVTFSIAASTPPGSTLPAPTPLSPSGTIDTVTPTFTWTAVTGADHYDVWVNTVTSGGESIGNPILRNENVSGTSWAPAPAPSLGLSAGQTYRWYVSAISSDGTHGLWSNGLTFSIASAQNPQTPTQVSPSGTIGTLTPTFAWTPVASAQSYNVSVFSIVNGLESPLPALFSGPITGTSWTPSTALVYGQAYKWYVSLNGSIAGLIGLTFSIAATNMPAPTPLIPSGTIDTAPPTFTWTPVSGADHYDVWVNTVSNGVESVGNPVLRNQHASGTSWTPGPFDNALVSDRTYKWYIGAVAADGNTRYSNGLTFSIGQPTPPAANPFAGSYGGSFSGSVIYLGITQPANGPVAFTIDSAGLVTVTSPGSGQGHCDDTGHITVDATFIYEGIVVNLHATGTIVGDSAAGQWTASTADGLGSGSGTWTARRSLPTPTPLNPSGSVSTLSPTFTWTPVPGADHYDIWVNTVTNGVESIGNPVVRNQYATGTSWTPSQALVAGQTYRWYISAVASDGARSPWSGGLTFSVGQAAPLPAPTPLAPSGTVATATPTFSWTAVAGADHYDVWINTVVNGVESIGHPVLRNQAAPGTSWTPVFPMQSLAAGSYRWYIGAVAVDGTTAWSNGVDLVIVL